MPDNIIIAKFKVRRGLDEDRKKLVLEQGELGYTTDTKRLFVGNGFVSGGDHIFKQHNVLTVDGSRVTLDTALKDDLVFENNIMYQLTGTDYSTLSSWANVNAKTDNLSLEYDTNNKLSIADDGVTTEMILNNTIIPENLSASMVFASGGISLNPTLGLSANIDNESLFIDNNNIIGIKDSGIQAGMLSAGAVTLGDISSSAIGIGLSGGDGDVIVVDVDNETITFDGNDQLTVGTISGSNISLGTGMESNLGQLQHFVQTIDSTDLQTSAGELSLSRKFDFNSESFYMPNISINSKGTIIGANNGTIMPLSSYDSGYGGFMTQASGAETNTTVSVVTGVSATNTQVLSSAGFVVLNIGTPTITDGDTRSFANSQYIAIPAFTIPQPVIDLIDDKFSFVEPYPYEWVGYRSFDPVSNDYTLGFTSDGGNLSAAACSGVLAVPAGSAVPVIIYSDNPTLTAGTYFAATTTSLTSTEYNSLSGWIKIEGESLYNVDGSNIIQSLSTCP